MSTLSTQDRKDLEEAVRIVSSGQALTLGRLDPQYLAAIEEMLATQVSHQSVTVDDSDAEGTRRIVVGRPSLQVAHSIKLSNFVRDPLLSGLAASQVAFAAIYVPEVLVKLPITFPGFLIAVTFAILRAFAQPIGFGEAALLHEMIRRSNEAPGGFRIEDLERMGSTLVTDYQYEKGANSNEIRSLVRSLVNWNAVDASSEGLFRPLESVVFTRSQGSHWRF